MSKGTVFVGLSGGVDSSVAALRLLRSGYQVVGVFIKVWQPDFIHCDWEAERVDAMRVAATLGIPFLTCNAEATYKQAVVDYLVREYEAGYTPNPDVMCNRHVKFGDFLDFARDHGASAIATGHYARLVDTPTGPQLHRGVDGTKDQSYFLWSIPPTALSHIHFPVGTSTKADIRAEAAAAGLPTAVKPDSQGICFLGQVDMKTFLGHFISITPGPVRRLDGEMIGRHDGAVLYTIGQRHGFTITTPGTDRSPYYVVRTDRETNSVYVSTSPPAPTVHTLTIRDTNHLSPWPTQGGEVQTRYRGEAYPVRTIDDASNHATLTLDRPIPTPAVGQSAVLYHGTHCLGGGILREPNHPESA
jgi:tRNA-specific 2-thiouridylase